MLFGTIFRMDPAGKFGFISPDNGGKDLFFHISTYSGCEGGIDPKPGQRVTYTVGKDRGRGPRVSEWEFDPFVLFGEVCHKLLSTNTQDGVHYLTGLGDQIPNLSDNIRLDGDPTLYQSLRIHKMDIPKFVARVRKWDSLNLEGRQVMIYMHGENYFFSNRWSQPGLPGDAVHKVFTLPIKDAPSRWYADGILGSAQALVDSGYLTKVLGALKFVPNPNPAYEPEYSGYYKKPE